MLARAIQKQYKSIALSKSVQQAAVLISGKAGVHLVALISQPLLARLYNPEQFGEFAFLNSILALVFIAASGRYESGIVLTKRKEQAEGLFELSQFFLIIYGIWIAIVIFLIPETVKLLITQKGISLSYLWAIPVMVIFSGYWQIVYNWLLRFQKYSQITIALLIQRLAIVFSALAAFYIQMPGNGLIFSLLFGFVVIFIVSLFFKLPASKKSFQKLKIYAFQFRDFPLFSIPTLLINLVTIHLPVLWITFFYNTEDAGIFSLAYSMTMVPAHLFQTSLGQIFYHRLAHTDKGNQYTLFLKYSKLYVALVLPVVLIATFFGERLTIIFLGERWAETGEMVRILALLMLTHGLSGICSYVLNVLRKQQFILIIQVIQFLIWILAFSVGLYLQDINFTLILMVFFSVLLLIFSILKVSKLLKTNDPHCNRSLANG